MAALGHQIKNSSAADGKQNSVGVQISESLATHSQASFVIRNRRRRYLQLQNGHPPHADRIQNFVKNLRSCKTFAYTAELICIGASNKGRLKCSAVMPDGPPAVNTQIFQEPFMVERIGHSLQSKSLRYSVGAAGASHNNPRTPNVHI